MLVGIPSLKIKEKFVEQITHIEKGNELLHLLKSFADACVHTWNTVEEQQNYVLHGALEACKLPNYRSFFLNGASQPFPNKKEKKRPKSGCKSQ